MGAPEYGLTVSGPSPMGVTVTLVFGAFHANANNACPMQGAPAGVDSLTITGSEMGSDFGQVTLCVPRPDELAKESLPLGSGVEIVSLNASDANCDYALDTSTPIAGTVNAEHECENGTDKAGFALDIAGSATLNQFCFTVMDEVPVTLSGTSAVQAGS
jgi:hypothetical protein